MTRLDVDQWHADQEARWTREALQMVMAEALKPRSGYKRTVARILKAPRDRQPFLIAALAIVNPDRFGAAAAHLGFDYTWQLHGAMRVALPHYPGADQHVAASILLGSSPAQALRGELTNREAHEYLSEPPSGRSAAAWLVTRHLPLVDWPRIPVDLHIDVARWLIAALRDPERRKAVYKPREVRFGDARMTGSLLEHLDDIRVDDLCGSVHETLRAAFVRMATASTGKAPDEPLAKLPDWLKPFEVRGGRGELLGTVRPLNTAAALISEGKEMSHCVALYAPEVARGGSFIVSVRSERARSTAQLCASILGDGLGQLTNPHPVLQHRGAGNCEPDVACGLLLRRTVTAWRARAEARKTNWPLSFSRTRLPPFID